MRCLCVNAGSSSLRLAVYEVQNGYGERRLQSAAAHEIGRPEAHIETQTHSEPLALADHRAALDALLPRLAIANVDAIGHRVVHGGDHAGPEPVTPALMAHLQALSPLAPLHLPAALAGIDALTGRFPALPQIACFDTAFHAGLPEFARTLPLPARWRERGIRRYGFHGLSYEYVVRKLGARSKGRVIVAHLGNGASLAALEHGRPVDTTMGFTPSGGVMMGTRSGDLDPGVLLYLLREEGLDARALERLIDRESGLLGVSGLSPDMTELLASETSDARLAVGLFAYQVRKAVGSLGAVLGGLDRLVFTGGIGENAAAVRWGVCRGLEHLGVTLDAAANAAHAPRISADGASCVVEIVPTDEDAMIARHVHERLETPHAE